MAHLLLFSSVSHTQPVVRGRNAPRPLDISHKRVAVPRPARPILPLVSTPFGLSEGVHANREMSVWNFQTMALSGISRKFPSGMTDDMPMKQQNNQIAGIESDKPWGGDAIKRRIDGILSVWGSSSLNQCCANSMMKWQWRSLPYTTMNTHRES